MSQWHYNENGQQQGPVELDQLKAMIAAGELTGTSLVWQVGTKDWSEVRNFTELVEQVQTPPPFPKSVSVASRSRTAATAIVDALPALTISLFVVGIILAIAIPQFKDNGLLIAIAVSVGIGIAAGLVILLRPKQYKTPLAHAWRRYFAKLLDIVIACLIGLIAVAIISPKAIQAIYFLFLGIFLLILLLFDVAMKGKSIGRYFFGVVLSHVAEISEGSDYLSRFAKMAFFGMGLGIPVLSAIANAVAYRQLRETGTTIWDRDKFEVTTQKDGIGKIILGVVLLLTLMSVLGVLSKASGSEGLVGRSPSTASEPPSRDAVQPSLPLTQSGPAGSQLEQKQPTRLSSVTPTDSPHNSTRSALSFTPVISESKLLGTWDCVEENNRYFANYYRNHTLETLAVGKNKTVSRTWIFDPATSILTTMFRTDRIDLFSRLLVTIDSSEQQLKFQRLGGSVFDHADNTRMVDDTDIGKTIVCKK